MENPTKMDALGVPPFQETSILNMWQNVQELRPRDVKKTSSGQMEIRWESQTNEDAKRNLLAKPHVVGGERYGIGSDVAMEDNSTNPDFKCNISFPQATAFTCEVMILVS